MAVLDILFDEAMIAKRVDQLAREIEGAIPGSFTIVALLKGSFVFAADLARALNRVGKSPDIEFMQLASYREQTTSSGQIELIHDVNTNLAGQRVLLIDDIADTGLTLAYARDRLIQAGVSEILLCSLLNKSSRREVELEIHFEGFRIGDQFVVGYGLDLSGQYRGLPYIGILRAQESAPGP